MSVSPSAGPIPSLSRRASVMEVPDVDEWVVDASSLAFCTFPYLLTPLETGAEDAARKNGADAPVPDAPIPNTSVPRAKPAKSKKKSVKKSAPDDLPDDIEIEVGHRNWAKGIREREILEPGMARYAEAMRSGNRAAVRTFILSKTNQYIYQIGWRTSLKHQPETLPHWDENTVVPEEPNLSEAEQRAKAWIIEQSGERIERWYTYRYETTHGKRIKLGDAKDPYSAVFSELARITSVKKALQGYQQYMRESYAVGIAHVVNRRWPTEPNKPPNATGVPPAWFRAKIGRELYNNLPRNAQAALKARAQEEAQRERARREAQVSNQSERTPETMQRAIDNLPGAMHRLMQGIAETTGLHFVLLGGGPMPRYGGEIRTVHMSIGQNHVSVLTSFPQWKRSHFDKEVLGSFKDYLETAYTPAERMAVALPDASDVLDDPDLLSMNDADMSQTPSSSSVDVLSSSTGTTSKRKRSSAASSSKPTDDSNDADDSDEEEDRERRRAFAKLRNENIARNKAMLDALNLHDATKRLMEQPAPAPKPRQLKPAPTGLPRRSLRSTANQSNAGNVLEGDAMDVVTSKGEVNGGGETGEDILSQASGPEQTDEEDRDSLDNSVDESTISSNPANPEPPIADLDTAMDIEPVSILPECPADAAPWLSKVYDKLTGKDLGSAYHGLMRAFFKLERAYGWVNGTGSFATDHRPKQIGAWVKNKRVATTAYCAIPNLEVYSREWWSWWSVNQPDWRERVDGKPAPGKEYKGGWEGLLVAGQNGMLNVVVSLYWWGCKELAVKGHSSTGWMQAVKDAEWVMRGIREAVDADM
ncbi:hypothetical protein C8F01DRAFT_1248142 [Mycena amicta]|nr:hypothetical protein C8F01DRAFT_1248142 [Mycena amicta]